MDLIDEKTKYDIEKAIHETEQKTNGEIVCVIADASANYKFFPLFFSIIFSLLLLIICSLLNNGWNDKLLVLLIASILFTVIFLIFSCSPINLFLTPKFVKKINAQRMAFEQFFKNKLHYTRDRAGILIFISVAEHYAEIIADKGINDKVDKNYWAEIVNDLTTSIKKKAISEGYLKAISKCNDVLITHFPTTSVSDNELPDAVVILKKPSILS